MPSKDEIFAKEVNALYNALPPPLAATFINALILVIVLFPHIEHRTLYTWFGLNLVLITLRLLCYRQFTRNPTKFTVLRSYKNYSFGVIASALLWGSGAFYLFPDSFEYGMFLVFITGGMAAGAIGSISYRFQIYVVYNILILLPYVLFFISNGGTLYFTMGVMLILFASMLLVSSKKFYLHFNDSIALQLQQQELVKNIEKEKEHIERLNAYLSVEIVEKEQAQESLVKALEETRKASAAKEAFFATMSHELRTPLNSIIGFSQILSRKKELPREIIAYMEKILLSGNHLLELVNSILDFSKLKAGKMEAHKQPFELCTLINEIEMIVEPIAHSRSITIIYPTCEGIILNADRKMLQQIFLNLLSNAIKFSPDNDRIKVSYAFEDNVHLFIVCDHGKGISSEHIETIFTPFTQLENNDQGTPKGTGLGLAIVKEMIDLHDGKIWVESIVDKGSCFYFTIAQ